MKQFTYFKLPAQSLHRSPYLLLIPPPPKAASTSSRTLKQLTLITTAPLRTHQVSILPLIDGDSDGLRRITRAPRPFARETTPIAYFTRSPDGSAIASKRVDENGTCGGEIFTRDRRGMLHNRQGWSASSADAIALLNSGRGLVVFDHEARTINVHLYLQGTHEEINTLQLPHDPPSAPSLLVLPSTEASSSSRTLSTSVRLLSITPTSIATFILSGIDTNQASLTLHSNSSLPSASPPRLVMPVDPMAWSHGPPQHRTSISHPHPPPLQTPKASNDAAPRLQAHDALVSVSEDGHLEFWIPAIEHNAHVSSSVTKSTSVADGTGRVGWTCTGGIRTGRTGIRLARCSSAKKTAIGQYDRVSLICFEPFLAHVCDMAPQCLSRTASKHSPCGIRRSPSSPPASNTVTHSSHHRTAYHIPMKSSIASGFMISIGHRQDLALPRPIAMQEQDNKNPPFLPWAFRTGLSCCASSG